MPDSGVPGAESIHELDADEPPSTSLEVSCDSPLLLPGTACVLTFQADGLPDLQYAGLELRFDTSRFTFAQVRAGSLFGEDAVVFARQLPNGRLGVSVSSTAGEREGSGGIVHLDFVVSNAAPHGTALFAVDLLEITDRDGSSLPAPLPETAEIIIPPYLTDAGITDPGPVTIARGNELAFRFRLAATGVTADDITGNGNRLTPEMVIVDAGTWDGSAPLPDPLPFDRIVPLAYTGTTAGQFRFEAPFPVEQPVGDWHVLARFQLDDHPTLTAGYSIDGGGLFDGESFTSVPVTVTTPRVTVAEWTFDGEQWTADTGLFLNLQAGNQAEISLNGARFTGWTTGSPGRAPNSNSWQQEIDDNNGPGGDDNDGGDNGGNNNGDNDNGSDDNGSDDNGSDDNGAGNNGDGTGIGSDNGGGDNGGTDNNGNGNENGDGSPAGSSSAHDKYWQAQLSTSGYDELTLQFRMSGSGTGPRDFRLYYSIDSDGAAGDPGAPDGNGGTGTWHALPGGDFQSSISWALTTLSLPPDAANAENLLLRWVRIGNTSIAGNDIGPTGTNRIDEIRITGVPLYTDEMLVWPGSTSGEGTVTEADVLNLGLYWMSTGPERVPRSIAWAPQPVVQWMPGSAAHADTDGDGRVDYRDLLAIGRNFGETVGANPIQQKIAGLTGDGSHDSVPTNASSDKDSEFPGDHIPLLEKSLPLLDAGESVRLVLHSNGPVSLTGLSTRFSLDQIPPEEWELMAFSPAGWADDWEASGRLIRFHHGRPHTSQTSPAKSRLSYTSESYTDPVHAITANTTPANSSPAHSGSTSSAASSVVRKEGYTSGSSWSAAWVHTGSVQPVQTDELAVIVIRAVSGWQSAPRLSLHRASLSTSDGVRTADATEWRLTRQELPVDAGRDGREDLRDLPKATRLHTGYPNPFNPVTTLSFDLHEPEATRLAVYDAIGRHVATLVDDHRDAGRHQVVWDASHLASGIYIVRLETAQTIQSRRVLLLK